MTKFLLAAIIVIFNSCTSNTGEGLDINSLEILEAGLRELSASGLIADNIMFSNRSFKLGEFSNLEAIPDSLAGLAVVPFELIFSNNQGVGLKSMVRKGETHEIVFWDYYPYNEYLVVLNLQLKAIRIDHIMKNENNDG